MSVRGGVSLRIALDFLNKYSHLCLNIGNPELSEPRASQSVSQQPAAAELSYYVGLLRSTYVALAHVPTRSRY